IRRSPPHPLPAAENSRSAATTPAPRRSAFRPCAASAPFWREKGPGFLRDLALERATSALLPPNQLPHFPFAPKLDPSKRSTRRRNVVQSFPPMGGKGL